MKRDLFGVLGAAAATLCMACGSSFVNRGLHDQSRWLQAQVETEASPAGRGSESLTYNARFEVQVSSANDHGAVHDAALRSALPALSLYARVQGQRVEVGRSENAQVLSLSYPLRLNRGDTVELRLTDRHNNYYRVQYGARDVNDWARESVDEAPLAQFSFVFEGSGRYFFHQGYAIFFVDFRPLR